MFFISFYGGLYYFRRTEIDNDEFSSYDQRNTNISDFGKIVALISLIIYSFIYAFPFFILYITILIIIITHKFSKNKEQL